MQNYTVNIINEFGESRSIGFNAQEYFNLMEMVEDKLGEEWGDCRGRGMCGTCHVEVINGEVGNMDDFEQVTIDGLPNKIKNSRLACQILTDGAIHNMTFKILKDY